MEGGSANPAGFSDMYILITGSKISIHMSCHRSKPQLLTTYCWEKGCRKTSKPGSVMVAALSTVIHATKMARKCCKHVNNKDTVIQPRKNRSFTPNFFSTVHKCVWTTVMLFFARDSHRPTAGFQLSRRAANSS